MDATSFTLLAQNDFQNGDAAALAAAGFMFVMFMFAFLLALVALVGMWKVFTKAGRPGWAALIPFYNMFVLVEITGKPLWWAVMLFIPCVNIVFSILIPIELAKCFGQGAGFAVGLILLPMIFYPILGFGGARYLGPSPG